MSSHARPIHSIAIIGAGIVGLSCALELADRGTHVALYDQNWPPRGASWAAAGMLAPAYEAGATKGVHPRLFDLCDASANLWPSWAENLEARTGLPSGYSPGPSLALAISSDQRAKLSSMRSALQHHDLAPKDVSATLAELEPAINGDIWSALLLPSDGQVDNRQTLTALIKLVELHPKIQIHSTPAPLSSAANGLDHAGQDATLVTAGWRTAKVSVRTQNEAVPLQSWVPKLGEIESYGGQMLSVAPVPGGPRMTIRAGDLYIVPKQDRIVIGATTERGRVLERPDQDVIADLLARAVAICPVLERAGVLESWVGVRPGTSDHAPIIGETSTPNLFVASGHYRNGILLAPITAQIIADRIVDHRISDLAAAFGPRERQAAPL